MNEHERAVTLLDGISGKVGGIRQRVDGSWSGSLDPLCERLQQVERLLEEIQETTAAAAEGLGPEHAEAVDTLPPGSRHADRQPEATDWKALLAAGAIVAAFMMFVAAADGTGASGDILFVGLLTTAVFGGAGWLAGARVMQHMSILPAVVAGFVAWVVLAGFLSAIGMGASSGPFAALFGAGAWYTLRSNAPPRA